VEYPFDTELFGEETVEMDDELYYLDTERRGTGSTGCRLIVGGPTKTYTESMGKVEAKAVMKVLRIERKKYTDSLAL